MQHTHTVFDSEGLRLLVAIARHGSFTAAAADLNYTQSAVSRRVAALEHQAGGPLFERLPRGVRLTPAGVVLYRHAGDVLNHLERAGEEVAAIFRGTGGRLRVGAFASANAALVPRALRAFRERRPAVDVSLIEGLSATLVERLADGAIDVAVVSDYPAGLTPPSRVELVPLLRDEFLVALPAGHPLTDQDAVDLRELRDEHWIEGSRPGQATMLATACAAAGFTPRVSLRVAEWTGKLGHVAAGLGVTLVPGVQAVAVRADVALRPLREHAPARTISAALPVIAPLPAARELVALLRSSPGRTGTSDAPGTA